MSDIRAISVCDILGAPELIEAYDAELPSPIGPANPQPELYRAMEASGRMQCFGAYERRGEPRGTERLVGFAVVLTHLSPDHGELIAVVYKMYCTPGSDGLALMRTIEKYAKEQGCVAISYSAPHGGRLEHVLQARRKQRVSATYCWRLT